MRINREDLISTLANVEPGLSSKDVISQGHCFAFKDGRVFTFNEELACSSTCALRVEGAVRAKPLMAILEKIPDDFLMVEDTPEKLTFKGTGKKLWMRKEAEVLLPIHNVEAPEGWKPLAEGLLERIQLASACAGRDDSEYNLTCIHLTPNVVEAMDRYQLIRCPIRTGLAGPTLIRNKAIKQVCQMDMREISETDGWVHFRNPDKGLVASCRRTVDQYDDLEAYTQLEGATPVVLPKSIDKALDCCEVFSTEREDNEVTVTLQANMICLTGEGVTGGYTQVTHADYKGPTLKFVAAPRLLAEVATKYNTCEVTAEKLRVVTDRFTFCAVLGVDHG